MINIPAVLIDRMREMEDRPRSAYDELAEAYHVQEAKIESLGHQIEALKSLNNRLCELLNAFLYNNFTTEGERHLRARAVKLLEEQ